MKRKLIKQGGGGFTFYLPKKWADSRGLRHGDEVDIVESGDFLLISSKYKHSKEIVLSFNKEIEQSVPSVTHCYRLGFDKIVVKSEDKNILSRVEKNALPIMLGFEVTDRKDNEIVLENISEPSEEKFEVMLRRLFLIIENLGNECVNLLEGNKIEVDNNDERASADKHNLFCRRTLTKKINSFHRPMQYWELLTYLMAIQHGYYYLIQYVQENKIKKVEQFTIDYMKKVNEYFKILSESYLNKDISKVSILNKLRQEVVFDIPDILIEKSKKPTIVSKIQYIARIVQLCSGSVFYLVLD